jgi:MarR family transcriptional regulator, transcriptional regulator for hemolysin
MSAGHELDAPPWRRVEATLMATARAIRQAYDRELASLGLNLSQASLVAFVAEFGAQSQSQLAARLNLGRAATGSVVDQLESRGIIERSADAQDRRVWRVDLTPEGRRLAAEIAEVDLMVRSRLRTGFTRSDRQRLAELLLQLQANLEG